MLKSKTTGLQVNPTKTANFNPTNNTWLIDGGVTLPDPTLDYVFVPPLPMLTPMQYYLAFTPTERITIKSSIDPLIKEVWATYQLAAQLNVDIDPNLVSVSSALQYMTTLTPPILTAARIPQILSGVAQ